MNKLLLNQTYVIVVTRRRHPESISTSAASYRQYACECGVILARLKEQADGVTSHGADSPWSRCGWAARDVDR